MPQRNAVRCNQLSSHACDFDERLDLALVNDVLVNSVEERVRRYLCGIGRLLFACCWLNGLL